jgi:hypothetical protein
MFHPRRSNRATREDSSEAYEDVAHGPRIDPEFAAKRLHVHVEKKKPARKKLKKDCSIRMQIMRIETRASIVRTGQPPV